MMNELRPIDCTPNMPLSEEVRMLSDCTKANEDFVRKIFKKLFEGDKTCAGELAVDAQKAECECIQEAVINALDTASRTNDRLREIIDRLGA